MNGQGFAYFRWRTMKFGRVGAGPFAAHVHESIWRDLQQRAFHRKMAKPKDKRT